MGLKKLLKSGSKVHIVKKLENPEKYFAPGILIFVENGAGELYEAHARENGNECYNLQLKGKPLFQLQGDEYFCPTCEKIVRTAYQLEQTEEFRFNKINSEEMGLEEFVSEITPVLKLLKSGFYCLWDTKLYPTDGNGNLFWDYPNNNNVLPGSCLFYFGGGEWGTYVPHFMIATQPKKLLNMERVNYYRTKPKCKAIAYYMDGNITALLDGHHKAMAAAMDHRPCDAVVISKCFCGYRQDSNGKRQKLISTMDIYFDTDELPAKFTKDNDLTNNCKKEVESDFELNTLSQDSFPCDIDSKLLASYYPVVKEVVSADVIGTITDEYIDDYINGKADISAEDYCRFLDALSINNKDRLFEIIDHTLYDTDAMEFIMPSLEKLVQMPKTEELKEYLISYMVEVEDQHPEAGRYIALNLW